jgi:integrase
VPGSTGPIFAISRLNRVDSARCSGLSGTCTPWHGRIPHFAHRTQYDYRVLPSEVAVAVTIANYRPRTLGAGTAAFARLAVAACSPDSPSRAKALLFATGKLGSFATSVGLELAPEICLHSSVIERFILIGCAQSSPATRRTLRSNLRFVARQAFPHPAPSPVPLSREHSKAPYTDAEIASYLRLTEAQPTLARRHRLGALVCLGAGAGLLGNELRGVTGLDVAARSGGVLVDVRKGRRPRTVPVLSCYHDRLLSSARFAKDRYLIGGRDPERENVTDRLVTAMVRESDLPRLDTGRLRASWLACCCEMLGLRAFMDAAGITCSQRLGDLIADLGVRSETETVALLGGRSPRRHA